MSYDTFWTVAYKGGFISGKRDTATGDEVIVYRLPGEHQWREAKSYLAAQQRISRFGGEGMIYAQFYHYDLSGNLVEACGDRSVVIIDARLKSRTIGEIAAEECKKRGYIAWAIFKGGSFTNSVRVSHIWHAYAQEPARDPAWLSAHDM